MRGLEAKSWKSPRVKIFMTKRFTRFARQQGIEDTALYDTVARANEGLIDADLGGGVIKQRIARRNKGKSGGFRSIILFRSGGNTFFRTTAAIFGRTN